MGKKQLVLVGNGMAGVRAIEEILRVSKDEFEITIFGAEPHPNYNRILLSKVLARRYRHSRHYVKRLELVQRKQHSAVYR